MRSGVPKVLHELCGRPMLDYVVEFVTTLRCRPVVAVIGAGARDVRARLPRGWRTVQQMVRRGTGHAVRLALQHLTPRVPSVLIVYGDQPLVTTATVQRLLETHRTSGARCTILTAVVADPQHYGRIVRDGDRLLKIVEETDATPTERALQEVNIGVAVFQREALLTALRHVTPTNRQHEYYLTDAITWLAEDTAGTVYAYRTDDATEALGVNSRADLAAAARVLRRRIALHWMERGVTIVDPETTYLAANVSIGEDTTIFPCTVIEREVRIGRRCTIGPFARVRSGSRLADGVRLGNFTETVRSRLGARTRMQHFSYIGDATVGADVNVGAGTITANYDGLAKHPTRIGTRAFVGSGTVVVAPASIGERAVTGAGCVITRGTRVRRGTTVVGVPARELRSSAAPRKRRR